MSRNIYIYIYKVSSLAKKKGEKKGKKRPQKVASMPLFEYNLTLMKLHIIHQIIFYSIIDERVHGPFRLQ